MERTFETVLVEQCAPTLVGVKPASLFRYQPGPSDEGRVPLERWREALAQRGIRMQVLKTCAQTGACMIYLYREAWLGRILSQPEIRDFLCRQGYRPEEGCQALLEQALRAAVPGEGLPPRDRRFPGVSSGGRGGFHPPPGSGLYLLRILESLR